MSDIAWIWKVNARTHVCSNFFSSNEWTNIFFIEIIMIPTSDWWTECADKSIHFHQRSFQAQKQLSWYFQSKETKIDTTLLNYENNTNAHFFHSQFFVVVFGKVHFRRNFSRDESPVAWFSNRFWHRFTKQQRIERCSSVLCCFFFFLFLQIYTKITMLTDFPSNFFLGLFNSFLSLLLNFVRA